MFISFPRFFLTISAAVLGMLIGLRFQFGSLGVPTAFFGVGVGALGGSILGVIAWWIPFHKLAEKSKRPANWLFVIVIAAIFGFVGFYFGRRMLAL